MQGRDHQMGYTGPTQSVVTTVSVTNTGMSTLDTAGNVTNDELYIAIVQGAITDKSSAFKLISPCLRYKVVKRNNQPI